MNIFQAIFSVLVLSLSGAAWAAPIPETMESGIGFGSFDLPAEQTGSFEVSFDATPLADLIDGFTGISAAEPRIAGDVAAIVRFNDTGTIDVRDGNSFRTDQTLRYSANKVYRVRMAINIASKTYSVFVTPAGEPEVSLARNYAFRSQQSGVKALRKLVLAGFKGSGGFFPGKHRVSGVSLKAISAP